MSVVPSPLFEPVLWQGTGFQDPRRDPLPEKIEYMEVSEVGQALEAVRAMKTRAFGQVLAFLYSAALLAQRHPDKDAKRCACAWRK